VEGDTVVEAMEEGDMVVEEEGETSQMALGNFCVYSSVPFLRCLGTLKNLLFLCRLRHWIQLRSQVQVTPLYLARPQSPHIIAAGYINYRHYYSHSIRCRSI